MKKFLLPLVALAMTCTYTSCTEDDNEIGGNDDNNGVVTEKVDYLYTFSNKSLSLVDKKEIQLTLINGKDNNKVAAPEDITVTFKVDQELSTAVEGVNFEFESNIATIQKGSNSCSVTLKRLGEANPEANIIVLKPEFAETTAANFFGGQFATTKIVILGSFAKDLVGTWVMNELVTDKEYMDEAWGGMATYGDAYPVFNANDSLTIEDTILPNFQSTLKNFFIGEASFEDAGTYTLRVGMGESGKVDLTILKVTGVNRNFDANSKSEDNTAYIGVRNITDDETDEPLLDVYLIDYVSTSFATELAEFGMYGGPDADHPYMAYMSGMFINFTMKQAK